MKKTVLFSSILYLCTTFATYATVHAQSAITPDVNGILYVDSVATSGGDGSSWQKALSQLADALNAADTLNHHLPGTVKQIWVAKGTYIPLYKVAEQYNDGVQTSNKDKSFLLIKNVQLYGGFAGNETSLSQRDITKIYTENNTTLTGILGNGDTAYHVFISSGDIGNALIDGFTITGGNADLYNPTTTEAIPEYPRDTLRVNGEDVINYGGGGLLNVNSSPGISHLIIQSNKGVLGGGIYNGESSSPKISKVIIRENTAADGGGMCNLHSSSIISNVSILDNIAQTGGGVMNLYGTPVFTNVVISRNRSVQAGGGIENGESAALFTNTVISDNTAVGGGGVANSLSTPIFTNVTFSNNAAEYGGGFYNANQSNTTLRNSVVLGNKNTKDVNSVYIENGSTATYDYSLIDSVYYQTNDPADTIDQSESDIFTNPATGDYTLKTGAWATNKGNNDYYSKGNTPDISDDSIDLAGNPRIFDKDKGGIVDLGAYESQGNIIKPDDNGILYVDSTATFNGDGSSWAKALPYLSDAVAFADTNKTVKEIRVAKGTYYPTGIQSDTTRDSTFLITRGGLKILGGYSTGGGPRRILDGVAQSNTQAASTILSGDIGRSGDNADNSYHVMVVSGVDPSSGALEISGFTINGGNAKGVDSMAYNGQKIAKGIGGGLVLNAGPRSVKVTVDSCWFIDNHATHGGGIFNLNTTGLFSQCSFLGNSAEGSTESSGGGIENGLEASPTFVNCEIAGNSAPLGGGVMNGAKSAGTFINCRITGNNSLLGGGVMNHYDALSTSFINCTISGNNAVQPMNKGQGGGIEGNGASCILTNCIVMGNSGGIDGSPTVNYSLVQDWQGSGSGNLPSGTDPRWQDAPDYTNAPFISGNYKLTPGSPVINKGSNISLPVSDTIDLAGNPRIFDKSHNGIVDMGAYEYQGNPFPTVITEQPQDTAVCVNGHATYTIAATGINLHYQWQTATDGGNTWKVIPGGLSNHLELSNIPISDSGSSFRVVVTGDWNIDTSDVATLSVFAAPVITMQLGSQEVSEGSDVAFTVAAAGAHLQYQWQSLNPDNLAARIRTILFSIFNILQGTNSGASMDQWKDITGATSAELYLAGVSTSDNGTRFRVIITGSCGTVTSSQATLTVVANSKNENPPPPGCQAPRITTEPTGQSVCPGGSAAFDIKASGSGLIYQWQIATGNNMGTNWNDVPGATTSVLTLSSIPMNDNGNRYRVKVTNACGATAFSNAVTLTVYHAVAVVRQPFGGFIFEGMDARIAVIATGNITGYQWQQLILEGNNSTWNDIPGATQPILQVNDVTAEDNGRQYRVIIAGKCNTVVSKSTTLRIVNPDIPIPFLNSLPFFSVKSQKESDNPKSAPGEYLVYPNPVSQATITIESRSGSPLSYISLYNVQGQQVLQARSNNNRIVVQLPKLIPGMYILRITDNRRHTYSEKIMVQGGGAVFR